MPKKKAAPGALPKHVLAITGAPGTLATKDVAVEVVRITYALPHDLVNRDLCTLGTYGNPRGKVLLHKDDRTGDTAWYKAHHDPASNLTEGWYINRKENRVIKKCYLHACEITYVTGEPVLFEYRLKN